MKKLLMIALLAGMLSSCATTRKNVTITPGVPIAFKDIERSNVVLSERPGKYDSIIITVVKQSIKRTNN